MEQAWVFLRHEGDVLFSRDGTGPTAGLWRPLVYETADSTAPVIQDRLSELFASAETPTLVRTGERIEVAWPPSTQQVTVSPSLFDCETRPPVPDNTEWVAPPSILTRETVPGVWRAYDRVRPTVQTVASDTEHGSATISLRALEVLRDETAALAAGLETGEHSTVAIARSLLDARPTMTAVQNRINRALATASENNSPGTTSERVNSLDPSVIAETAHEEFGRALTADSDAAENAAATVEGGRLVTLSKSGTVLETIQRAGPDAVLVSESRPGGEGVGVARQLAADTAVTLTTDAGLAYELSGFDADAVVVGADSILADGRVVNKVGTRQLAICAARADVPVYVVAARDKVSPESDYDLAYRGADELAPGSEQVAVSNPTFDVTPTAVISAVITERGQLSTPEIRAVASEHAGWAGWTDRV